MSTRRATSAVLAAALLLTACTVGGDSPGEAGSAPVSTATASDGSESSSESSSESTSAGSEGSPTSGGGPSPYLPVPDGVVLADPGSEYGLGETANVAWRLAGGDGVGVLSVKVRRLVRARISVLANWQLDAAGRRSSLYYVTVTVANRGKADLSGLRIPLYALAGTGALVESSEFKTDFDPCPSPDLPDEFVTGKKVTVCQAFLVPERGELKAVVFRPAPSFNPITWVGKVAELGKSKKSNKTAAAG